MHKMERVLDVDLFLGAQDQWAEDSPHCLTILHEMFLHATSEGQKEAEWYVCWGVWQQLPQLNPEADISAIQLVWPETSREELLDIYLEVYKLHRLPGSLPGELAILEEVSTVISGHSQEKEEAPNTERQWSHPSQMQRPQQRRETSVDRCLERVQEVHQKALLAAATLEEEIKRLHQIRHHSQSEVRPKSQCHWRSEGTREKRHCMTSSASKPTSGWFTDPDTSPGEMEPEDGTSNLGEPPKLKAEVASFLEGSSEMSDGGSKEMLQEPAVSKFSDWVRWKVGECDTPSWWAELLTVLGEDDIRRLAQEVRALFQLPRWMHELEHKEAPFQVPQHCHVSTASSLCLWLYLSMLAETSGRFPGRRW